MINYRGKPLFGEDSSVSNTSEFFAIAGTIVFWLLFLIFSFVIKPQPKKQYKEVQIVLSSTPVVQKTEEAPAPAEAASASASEASVQSETAQPVVETPPTEAPASKSETAPVIEKTAPKTTEKKVETTKTKTQPQVKSVPASASTPIYKSNEELLEEQLRNKKNRDENYDPWADESNDDEKINPEIEHIFVNNTSNTEGIAGKAAGEKSGDAIKSSQNHDKKNDNVTQGNLLQNIIDAKDISASGTGVGKGPEKSSGIDREAIKWAEGSGSRTVYNFDTELSTKAKNSMQVSKPTPFTISFSVDADGNVMGTTIEIKNEFILSDIIKKEMKEKISSWKFGKGSGISKAQFDWILSPGN